MLLLKLVSVSKPLIIINLMPKKTRKKLLKEPKPKEKKGAPTDIKK